MTGTGVDWEGVYSQVPEVMGLPGLRLRGGRWTGPYYMDGTESVRPDKLVVLRGRRGDGMLTVMEQGGETLTLVTWLIRYRGLSSKEVYPYLESRDYSGTARVPEEYSGPALTVDRGRYVQAGGGSGRWSNPLYCTLAGVWGSERVSEVFARYGVTDGLRERSTGVTGTRFWYIDRGGDILYDKTMFYGPDGHRIRELHPMRQYRRRDGYTRTCYYGENTVVDDGRPVMVLESEKSALICALEFPGWHWVACGGLRCLRRLGRIQGHRTWLVPDIDGAEAWAAEGRVWRWWEKMEGIAGPKWDFADAVMYKYRNRLPGRGQER